MKRLGDDYLQKQIADRQYNAKKQDIEVMREDNVLKLDSGMRDGITSCENEIKRKAEKLPFIETNLDNVLVFDGSSNPIEVKEITEIKSTKPPFIETDLDVVTIGDEHRKIEETNKSSSGFEGEIVQMTTEGDRQEVNEDCPQNANNDSLLSETVIHSSGDDTQTNSGAEKTVIRIDTDTSAETNDYNDKNTTEVKENLIESKNNDSSADIENCQKLSQCSETEHKLPVNLTEERQGEEIGHERNNDSNLEASKLIQKNLIEFQRTNKIETARAEQYLQSDNKCDINDDVIVQDGRQDSTLPEDTKQDHESPQVCDSAILDQRENGEDGSVRNTDENSKELSENSRKENEMNESEDLQRSIRKDCHIPDMSEHVPLPEALNTNVPSNVQSLFDVQENADTCAEKITDSVVINPEMGESQVNQEQNHKKETPEEVREEEMKPSVTISVEQVDISWSEAADVKENQQMESDDFNTEDSDTVTTGLKEVDEVLCKDIPGDKEMLKDSELSPSELQAEPKAITNGVEEETKDNNVPGEKNEELMKKGHKNETKNIDDKVDDVKNSMGENDVSGEIIKSLGEYIFRLNIMMEVTLTLM